MISDILCTVNLGKDADTTAAIYGQVAGAYYGASGIPKEWAERCSLSPLIMLFAEELTRLSAEVVSPPVDKHSFPSPHEVGKLFNW